MTHLNQICSSIDIIGQDEDKAECDLSSGEPAAEREAPLGSVNGKPETDDKENNNGLSTEETQAVRYD